MVLEQIFAVIAAGEIYKDFPSLCNFATQNLYALCTTIILLRPVADFHVESFRGARLVKNQFTQNKIVETIL